MNYCCFINVGSFEKLEYMTACVYLRELSVYSLLVAGRELGTYKPFPVELKLNAKQDGSLDEFLPN